MLLIFFSLLRGSGPSNWSFGYYNTQWYNGGFAVCKMFYNASRKNKLFVKKLHDSRKLYNGDNKKWIISYHSDVFVSFSNQLFVYLKENVNEENLFLTKNVIMDRLYYSVLPFRVWNYLFLCERSQYMTYNNNLFIHMSFLPSLKKEFG